GRLQASQRADRALAWAIGGLDGFDKQMVGVGFTFVVPGCLPDIHWPLHIAVYTGAVNINCVYFSHYYRSFKTRTHKKRLGEDFPEMVQKSVEVGLTGRVVESTSPRRNGARVDVRVDIMKRRAK